MPIGLRLRKDPKIKSKISSGRTKPSKNSMENADRKNNGIKGNAKKRGSSKLELDGIDSDSELYEGKVGRNWKSHSGVKGKVELDHAERKRKRADNIKHVGNARKSLGLRLSDKRTLWKSSDMRISWKQNSRGKRREFDKDDSDEEMISGGAASELKGRAGKKNSVRGSKDSCNREDRHNKVEASAQKLKPKGKIIDGVKSTERGKEDDDDKVSDKVAKGKDRSDQTAEQKQVRFQTRVLDKTGKKIRGHKKSLDDESEEAEAPPKKRKRVIKIDPYDISNKRLDDGILNSEKAEEKEVELSKNAQFRAIQPSPSILSFVENNLLGRRRLIELQNAGYNVKLSAPLDNGPFSTSAEREQIEENVFRNKLEFFAAAKISSSFPPPVIPEIAFAGRSNVGKSSLLNALTRQWGVVRTSDKPGYTQTINFFRLASKLCLVDLPGYGFAYAKEEVKDAWEELVKEYVSTRVGLKRVCLLIDTKWGMKQRDHELIDLMERYQTPYQIVLTKTDAVFPIDVARRAMQVQENLNANNSIVKPVMMVSSKSGAGIQSLRTVLAKIARFAKP